MKSSLCQTAEIYDPGFPRRVARVTLREAGDALGALDEFVDEISGRFGASGKYEKRDIATAVTAVLDSELGDSRLHRDCQVNDLVMRLRTRLYEDGRASLAVAKRPG